MSSKKPTSFVSEKKYSEVPPAVAERAPAAKTAVVPVAASAPVATPAVTATPIVAATPGVTSATPVAKSAHAETHSESSTPSPRAAELIAGLNDSSAENACEAALSLGDLKERTAVEPLMQVLANVDGFYHSVVRSAAACSLGQIADARAVPALLSGLHDAMAEASAESVRALASIGDVRAVGPLIEVVQNANGYFLPIVRRAAVLALHKLGGPAARAQLERTALNADEEPAVRQSAADAMT